MARKRKDIDWEAQPLGEVTDQEIADRLGVDPSTVSRNRKRLGVEANNGRALKHCPDEWFTSRSDAQAAEEAGVSCLMVARERRRRGLYRAYNAIAPANSLEGIPKPGLEPEKGPKDTIWWMSAILSSLAKHGDPTEVAITFGDRVVRLRQTVRIVEVE